MDGGRSDVVTIVAVAVVAYAACDLVHEVAGHGFVALLMPGVDIVSLSTVALQSTGSSRAVAAAGSVANILAGAAALALARRRRTPVTAYFLWLSGSVNLLNAAGYPVYSAVLGYGDWDVVLRGMEPGWLWRAGLGVGGAFAYAAVVMASAGALTRLVRREVLRRNDVVRLVFVAYVAGGVLLLVAALFNPVGPALILLSGVSSGFAAMAGLTLVPRLVERRTAHEGPNGGTVIRSPGWIAAGLIVGAGFVAIVGPGIVF